MAVEINTIPASTPSFLSVVLSSTPTLPIAMPFTMMIQIHPKVAADLHHVMNIENTGGFVGDNGYRIGFHSTDGYAFASYGGPSPLRSASISTITLNNPHSICGIFTSTTSRTAGLDGILGTPDTGSGGAPTSLGGWRLNIGVHLASGGGTFGPYPNCIQKAVVLPFAITEAEFTAYHAGFDPRQIVEDRGLAVNDTNIFFFAQLLDKATATNVDYGAGPLETTYLSSLFDTQGATCADSMITPIPWATSWKPQIRHY